MQQLTKKEILAKFKELAIERITFFEELRSRRPLRYLEYMSLTLAQDILKRLK